MVENKRSVLFETAVTVQAAKEDILVGRWVNPKYFSSPELNELMDWVRWCSRAVKFSKPHKVYPVKVRPKIDLL